MYLMTLRYTELYDTGTCQKPGTNSNSLTIALRPNCRTY